MRKFQFQSYNAIVDLQKVFRILVLLAHSVLNTIE